MSPVQFTFYSACRNFWIKGIAWPLFVRLSDTMSSFQNPYQNIFFFRNFAQQLNVIVILSGCAALNILFFSDCFGTQGVSSMWHKLGECGKDLDGFQRSGEKGGEPGTCCQLDEEPGCDER